MKDVFDMVTDVRSLINIPAITNLIDGKVYPSIRPDGSVKSDIVVNGLNITNTQDQIGSGNINVFVPKISSGGVLVNDQARIMSICKAISSYVNDQYRASFRLKVMGASSLERDTDGSYFGNIRYKYYSLQSDFKQI